MKVYWGSAVKECQQDAILVSFVLLTLGTCRIIRGAIAAAQSVRVVRKNQGGARLVPPLLCAPGAFLVL